MHRDIGRRTIEENRPNITTAANELVGSIHDRIPVVIPSERFNTWLNERTPDALVDA